MRLIELKPRKALNKAYLKEKVKQSEIDLFRENLKRLLESIGKPEFEEHVKNEVTTFLYDTYYKGINKINTKGRIDLAIYEDSKPVVLIEAKRPGASEMITKEDINRKALHELILYYLQERVEHNNTDIKYLIATDCYEWFVFDAAVFDKRFYQNGRLLKDYKDWENKRKSGSDRPFFYNEIVKPFLNKFEEEIVFTRLDLREIDLDKPAEEERKLIPAYKLFSPPHLLKLPFANDSNSLDKKFYHELLHIIGLEEIKVGSKKVILRKAEPDPGSLLENTMNIIVVEDRLRRVQRIDSFGDTHEERLFNVALQLCITWVDRILFLKLLEGQLLNYHGNDRSYRFMDYQTIHDNDELNKLFFQVLAVKSSERREAIKDKFAKVPYLNSSLFDINDLEDDTIRINSLDDSLDLPIFNKTVLKNEKGKRREGTINTLQYLFEFLDAYDFSSEGKEEIQEENKTLINASVLGLIFEKINGYKDGSFFTPGFITMYMCRETIQRAVVQKFNDLKGWKCEELKDLHNYLEPKDIQEANEIINSLKICDPAVGSGHFLVSALNELIAIKSELGILIDREGKKLRDYTVEVVNDELIVSIEKDELYEYRPGHKESQRVQEALFHEKETLIENCLFGVDINPNSVKICRLRLWIELLKNAYYTPESKYTELETLPNIDINIKEGNSLISRFSLDEDLSKALKSIKYSIDDYRSFVNDYKNATDKEEKRGFQALINQIKADFRTQIGKRDPKVIRKNKLAGELFNMVNQTDLIEPTEKQKREKKKKIEKLEKSINKIAAEIEDIKNSAIYRDAFEWRFEFPEVLDDEGNFVGFDVVIGNPPYINIVRIGSEKERSYLMNEYDVAKNKSDLYSFFIEAGIKILKEGYFLNYITSNSWYSISSFELLRKYLVERTKLIQIVELYNGVFDEATVIPAIILLSKHAVEENKVSLFLADNQKFLKCDFDIDYTDLRQKPGFNISFKPSITLRNDTIKLGDLCSFSLGIKTGNDKKFIKDQDKGPEYHKIIRGKDISQYKLTFGNKWIWYNPEEMKENIGARPRVFENFKKDKVILKEIGSQLVCTIDRGGYLVNDTVNCLFDLEKQYTLEFIVGILNSKLLNKWYQTNFESGLHIKLNQLAEIPIPVISNESSKILNDKVAEIIRLIDAKIESDISKLEAEIDQLVYELYGLTGEEIKIVEGAVK